MLMLRRIFIVIIALTSVVVICFSQTPIMNFSSVAASKSLNDKVIFVANDGIHGEELWVTDGTVEGTNLLKDIYPGYQGSSAQFFTLFNNKLFFNAYSPETQAELWSTDGTSGGTQMVADLSAFNSYTAGTSPASLKVFKGSLYFTSSDGKLYKTNGEASGTTVVDQISYGRVQYLTIANDKLYYYKTSDILQRTDGNVITEIDLPLDIDDTYFSGLFSSGQRLFAIRAASNNTWVKLYSLDPATDTWTKILDVKAPLYGSQIIDNTTVIGDKVFFSLRKDYSTATDELWVTDGTAAGTIQLRSTAWDRYYSGSESMFFTEFNGMLYFRSGNADKKSLWKSDGTVNGTVKVHDVEIMAPNYQPNPPVAVGGRLYFGGNISGTFNTQPTLWSTDGTQAGTKPEMDLSTNLGSLPHLLAAANGNVFFVTKADNFNSTAWTSKPADEINVNVESATEVLLGGQISFYDIQNSPCASKTITVRNDGKKALAFGTVYTTGPDFLVTGTVPEVLLPGTKFSFKVFFNPLTEGNKSGKLVITSSDLNEGNFSIRMSATAGENGVGNFCDDVEAPAHFLSAKSGPKAILLTNTSVTELLPAGTVVGSLSVQGQSQATFTLVAGDGDTHNEYFVVEGNELKTKKAFTFGDHNFYTVRINASSADGSKQQDYFSIEVINQLSKSTGNNCAPVFEHLDYALTDLAVNSIGQIFTVTSQGQIQRSDDDGNSWTITRVGGPYRLTRIFFKNNTGFVLGENILLKSEDNGGTWFQIYTPAAPISLSMLTEQTGYVAGSGGSIYFTDDGCRTWIEKKASSGFGPDGFTSIWFTSMDKGFGISSSYVYQTSDGGETWKQVQLNASGYYTSPTQVIFVSETRGFLVSANALFRTTDGGDTWTQATIPYSSSILRLQFVNASEGYFLDWYGGVSRTTDGGDTWTNAAFLLPGRASAIARYNSKLFMTLAPAYSSWSSGRVFTSSSDNGATWDISSQIMDENFSMVYFPLPDFGLVSAQSANYRTTDGGITWEALPWFNAMSKPVRLDDGTLILSDGNAIFRSTDNGTTITEVLRSPDYPLYQPVGKLYKLSNERILSINGPHFYASNDSGITWEYTLLNTISTITDAHFISSQTGFLLDLFGSVYKTTDSGANWARIFTQDYDASDPFTAIFFANDQTGFKAGKTFEKTTDGGVTWNKIFTTFGTDVFKLFFTSESHGYAICRRQMMYETFDGGLTWKEIYTQTSYDIYNADFENDAIYLTGQYGYIGKFSTHQDPPLMPGYISGDMVVCPGTVVTYNLPFNYTYSYNWSLPNVKARDGATWVEVYFPDAGEYTLSVQANNACKTTETRSLTVKVQGVDQPTIQGNELVTPKAAEKYEISNASLENHYFWQISPSITFAPAQSSSSIQVTWPDVNESDFKISTYAINSKSACKSKTPSLAVKVLRVTSLEGKNDGISVYPNPTSVELRISSGDPLMHAGLVDLSGKAMVDQKLSNGYTHIINIETLPSGLYILKLKSKNGSIFTRTIVKQ